jgi:citrate lyase beta subunit
MRGTVPRIKFHANPARRRSSAAAASSPPTTRRSRRGGGAVTVDGKMIDVPVVERARRLVEREEAIAAHEARMKAMAAQF